MFVLEIEETAILNTGGQEETMVAATKAQIEKSANSATDGDMIKATAISKTELEMRNRSSDRIHFRTFVSGQLPKRNNITKFRKAYLPIYLVFCFLFLEQLLEEQPTFGNTEQAS